MFTDAIAMAANVTPQTITQTPMVPGLTLHLDGDFLAYNAAGNEDCLPGQARLNALDKIEMFRVKTGAEHVVVHTGAPGCTKGERFLIAQVKPYQGNRSSGRKPKNQPYLMEFLQSYTGDVFRSKLWSTREADDGIAACSHFAIGTAPGYAAIATKDKDMRMLPGLHVDWDTLELIRVNPGEYDVVGNNGKQYGLKWFWAQMLMGDTADNCPGLEYYKNARDKLTKVGEVTAFSLLAPATNSDEASDMVQGWYWGAYGDETWADRFVEQAGLMWMRCGVTADIDDFATHAGHSRINQRFPKEIYAAVDRMKERVSLARTALNELTDQVSPG